MVDMVRLLAGVRDGGFDAVLLAEDARLTGGACKSCRGALFVFAVI
jgi:hypothetical protein